MTEYIIRPPERVDSSLSLWPIIVGEIVRCRDCKYYVDASPRSTRYRIKGPRCLLFSDNKVVSVKPDAYCWRSERKEGGDD